MLPACCVARLAFAPTLFNRSMPFPTAREFLAVVGFTSFIVCYCPAVLLLSSGSSHDDDGRGRGRNGLEGERVSRDRPRCPVLHCRSAVRRRPAHRRHHCRHHVWLGTEGGRDRSSCPSDRPSVLHTTFALLSSWKVRWQSTV